MNTPSSALMLYVLMVTFIHCILLNT